MLLLAVAPLFERRMQRPFLFDLRGSAAACDMKRRIAHEMQTKRGRRLQRHGRAHAQF
jgi:hypothetical protein